MIIAFGITAFINTPISAKKPMPLILKHANYNKNTLSGGKLISILKGNVIFLYDDAEIRSEYAEWFRSDGIAKFRDSVRINREFQKLKCDRMNFYRKNKLVTVLGNVDFFDKEENIRLLSQKGTYHLDTKQIDLDKDPRLFRYDTTANDTLEIIGRQMTYDDSMKIATVTNDVKIFKGLMESQCQIAYYYPDNDIARLRKSPVIYYDIHQLVGDSVDLLFAKNLLRGISAKGNTKTIHKDFSAKDSLITEITGDSLFMQITEQGNIDTIWVYNDVTSRYYSKEKPFEANEAKGKIMVLCFNDQGNANNLIIQGNAQSTYYVDDESGAGRNEASGDRIDLFFKDGRASHLVLTGAVRGIYFAEEIK